MVTLRALRLEMLGRRPEEEDADADAGDAEQTRYAAEHPILKPRGALNPVARTLDDIHSAIRELDAEGEWSAPIVFAWGIFIAAVTRPRSWMPSACALHGVLKLQGTRRGEQPQLNRNEKDKLQQCLEVLEQNSVREQCLDEDSKAWTYKLIRPETLCVSAATRFIQPLADLSIR